MERAREKASEWSEWSEAECCGASERVDERCGANERANEWPLFHCAASDKSVPLWCVLRRMHQAISKRYY